MTPTTTGLARRLPWLLVFRAVVATALLVLTIAADIAEWQQPLLFVALYGVVAGSYLVVLGLALLLRAQVSPVVIGAVHLTTILLAAAMVVQATGGVESGFTFLYVLAVLDGAIIGGRPVALTMATAATLAFGAQLVLQLYEVFTAGLVVLPPPTQFIVAFVTHLAALYLVALLAGHLAQLLLTAVDEAAAARTDLRRAEGFMAAAVEALPVGLLTVGEDGIVRSANPAAARILGDPALVGRGLPAALAEAWRSTDQVHEVRVTIAGRPVVLGVRRAELRHALGSQRATADTSVILLVEDRTALEELQASLRRQERLASIGQMAAAIAHDLRNPLAAISGAVELLANPIDEATRRRLESIVRREVERLDHLVGDLLVYARPPPLEPTATDLAALLCDLQLFVGQDPTWKERRVVVDAPATLVAEVDAGKLRQAIWNLLRNALEASPPDRPVELALAERDQDGGGGLLLRVRDYGAGVAPEMRATLFEPFHTTKSRGTGLGLAVVKRIVEAHGGGVMLRDAVGGGTSAEITLPALVPGKAGR